MKCVITGKETNDYTKGIPVHREARPMIDLIHNNFNVEVMEAFIKEQKELQGEKAMSEDLLRKIAPQYNKAQVLRMIQREGVEGIFEALERASQKAGEELAENSGGAEEELNLAHHADPDDFEEVDF